MFMDKTESFLFTANAAGPKANPVGFCGVMGTFTA
jgi:hypothetical protein